MHPREQLVAIMRRIYNNGMTTLSGGNLSIREQDGTIWITPAAIDKGNLTPNDIICMHPDGTISGPHKPSSEYPFHQAIYAARPDLYAIVHAHPPALVAFSIARRTPNTNIIPQAQRVCGPVGYAPYALPGSEQLGANIATTFAEGFNVVLLENHGIATGGANLLEAFQRLETLDFCARTELKALDVGGEITTLTEEQLTPFDRAHHLLPEFDPDEHPSRERELRQQIVDIVRRAYDRQLMISTEGVVSARVDEDSFLITPTGADRRSLELHDIVLVRNGQRERGKLPSRSVRLHQAIYTQHPAINCVISAQSPHDTAYAITTATFETKTIPESYILLRDIPVVPYGTQYTDPKGAATAIAARTPVVLLKNDCILAVGENILQTFDRLEVAEFSAKSLIETGNIGKLIPISEAEVRDLEEAFSLPS
ncbi:MAG: class II aldolase/adducin family protein [Anaerolineae bacterium]|nr:class II aldolase/adducin family protein [Anaerolineae bacterium]